MDEDTVRKEFEASPTHAKLPIDRPCSACSAGDAEMEHHDHTPPFREAKPVSTEVCNNCRKSLPCECSRYGDTTDATSAEQFWKRIDALEAALGSRKYQLDKAGETILRLIKKELDDQSTGEPEPATPKEKHE